MLRLSLIPLGLLVLLAGAMFWSGGAVERRADFTFINRGENKTLDLGVMSWMQDIRLAYQLWEGLYTLDPKTLEPIPGVADRIELSADKTVYTFHIRPTARWSDGKPLTSGDFIFGWRRMLEQPGEYTYLFDYLKGARNYEDAYGKWKEALAAWDKAKRQGSKPIAPDFGQVGVEAPDRLTLRVTLEHPVAYFPSLCAYIPFFPQYEPCMKAFAQLDSTGTYIASYDQSFTRPPNLVSNGPYALKEWSFKRRVRLTASPHYWNAGAVQSRVIDQIYADDALAQFRMYEGGGVDWLADVDGDMAADLLDKGRKDLHLIPAFGTYFYDFNCNPTLPNGVKNPFADARVRRAFSMAIDKRPIVENVTRTGEPIATTYIPRGVFADYVSPPGIAYQPQEAARLLAEAGYRGGAGFPRVRILFNNDFTQHGEVAQVIRRQWQQTLGVVLDLEGVEIKVFGDRLHQHEFDVCRGSWYGDYDDPSTFTDVYKSTSDNNNPAWKNTAYDELLERAAVEPDQHKRLKILADAENLMLEDAPIVPLFQYVGRYLYRDNVQGIPLDARQMIMMQSVKVDRR